MVYGVSGQRMACAVIIVIYHDGISTVHVLSQVLRSCTELDVVNLPFARPVPCLWTYNLTVED